VGAPNGGFYLVDFHSCESVPGGETLIVSCQEKYQMNPFSFLWQATISKVRLNIVNPRLHPLELDCDGLSIRLFFNLRSNLLNVFAKAFHRVAARQSE
jgi:hypothetical protein